MLKRLFIIILFATLVAATVFGFQRYIGWHEQPLPGVTAGATIDVPSGEALGRLAERLEHEGVIEHAWEMKVLARLRGEAGSIHAGEYELEPGMTLAGLLDQLVAGKVKLHALTIVEGNTAAQLFAQMAAHPALKQTLENYEYDTVARALGLEGDHPEGWFLPETYRFPRGTSDLEFLQRAYAAMQRVLTTAWDNRAADIPLTSPYEVLILASIIEKETSIESERRTIAGVFARRLQRGMRLQTDPTVIYGIEDYDGRIRTRDLRADTPYNTYTRGGLTPTPIALPGRASINAAVNPEDGDALYFVALGDGSGRHKFSATLEEHNRAVAEYLRRIRTRGTGN